MSLARPIRVIAMFRETANSNQSTFPAPLKLMVGRVDLANMPGRLTYGGPASFPSELELLRNYLNKDHKFRAKQLICLGGRL